MMQMKQCPLNEREEEQQHQQYQQQCNVIHNHRQLDIDIQPSPIGSSCYSRIRSSYAYCNDGRRGGGENTKLDVARSASQPNRVELSFEEDKSQYSSDDIDDEMKVGNNNEMLVAFDDMVPLPYKSEDESLGLETAHKSSDDNSLDWDVPNGHDLKNRFFMNLIQSPLLE